MSGVDGRCSSTHQHGIRQDLLQAGSRRKDKFPIRKRCGALQHSASKSDSAGRKDWKDRGDKSVPPCPTTSGHGEPHGAGQPNPASGSEIMSSMAARVRR